MGQHDKEWGTLVTLLADQKEEWWATVMGVGLDPELTKRSVRSGLVNFLTGRGYKEYHWLVIPHQPPRLSSHQQLTPMSSDYRAISSCIIPGLVNQLGIGHAAICVHTQMGRRSPQNHSITPFMFNEEEYRVSPSLLSLHMF